MRFNKLKTLKNDKLIFTLSSLLYSGTNFIFIFILTRVMKPSVYGEYNSIIIFGTLLSLIMILGNDQVIMRYYYSKNLISLLINHIKVFVCVNIFIIIILLIISLLSGVNNYIYIYLYALVLTLFRMISIILRMQSASLSYAVYSLFSKFIELAFIFVFIFMNSLNQNTAIISYLISVMTLSIILVLRMINKIEYKNDRLPFKEQYIYSIPMFGSILLTTLGQNIDKIILPVLISTHEIGIYFSAFKLTSTLLIFQGIFSLIWMPEIIKKFERKTKLNLANTLFKIQSILVFLISILIFSNELLIKFLGEAYADAILILPILFLVPYFMMMAEIGSVGITLKEKSGYHFFISLTYIIFSTLLILYLSPIFGVQGVAYAVVISTVLYYLLRNYIGLYLIKEKVNVWHLEIINFCIFLLPFLQREFYTTFLIMILMLNLLNIYNLIRRRK